MTHTRRRRSSSTRHSSEEIFRGRQSRLGGHIGFGSDPGTPADMEIIGVVKDIHYTSLRDEIPEQAFEPYMASRGVFSMTVYGQAVVTRETVQR